MKPSTYRKIRRWILALGLLSVLAVTIWTIVAYQNASIVNYVAGELW